MKRLFPLLALTIVVLGIPISLVVLPRVQAANVQKKEAQDFWAQNGFNCTWYIQGANGKFAGVMEFQASDDRAVPFCFGIVKCVRNEREFYDMASCRWQPDKLCLEINPHACIADRSGLKAHMFERDNREYNQKRAKRK